MMNVKLSPIVDTHGRPMPSALGGGYQGAGGGFGGELSQWSPPALSADAALLPDLQQGNARADDLARNHGIAAGAADVFVDHVVGHQFKPTVKLNWKRLGITAEQAKALAAQIESAWEEYAEDPVNCFIDAERKRTFTMLIREGIRTETRNGEILASAEWINNRAGTEYHTAIKPISVHRLSNPGNAPDGDKVRGGIESDAHGAARFYHIREAANTMLGMYNPAAKWKRVARAQRWGRQNILHVFEPFEDGQTRGANRFLSVMSRLKMLDKFQATQLQTAIVNATYAAVIESELSSEQAFEIIGGQQGAEEKLAAWMATRADYAAGTNLRLNGSRIPHLMPGEELKLLRPGNTAAGFSDFEAAVLRYVAAGLGVSYEQLTRDYSKTNYSSARASSNESHRTYMGKRTTIAARYASMIYSLWLEEWFYKNRDLIPSGAVPFNAARAAWCRVKWIGAGRSQIDGLKEIKEAILKIEAGLSTYEQEIAQMGSDYREVFDQQVREMQERKAAGLPAASWVATQALAPDVEEPEQPAQPQQSPAQQPANSEG